MASSSVNAEACWTPIKNKDTDVPVTLRIELDRPVLPANTTGKAIVKVSLDGIRRERAQSRPPVNLVVVLDRSGSMSGEKIVQAKAAAIEALNRLAADDIFSLIAFDNSAQTIIPATRIGDGEALESKIRKIGIGGSTALFAGVSQGASELRKHIEDPRYIHRIILLSDGQANQGPSSPAELGRLGSGLVKEGISVTTVGLGLGYDEDLMTRLALRSDGNTYFVEGASDLSRIFTAELGEVLNIVARRVVIKIEFPDSVRPIRFIGRDGSIDGQNAVVTLNQIYGGQEKYALIEVEVPARDDGTQCTIVNANVVFEDPVSQKTASLSARQDARFSADKELVISSANQRVQTDYASNLVAVTKEKAIALLDAGDKNEAARIMAAEASGLSSLGSTYTNRTVLDISADFAKDAKLVEKEGYGQSPTEQNYMRKSMVSGIAAAQTQQVIEAVVTSKETYTVKAGDTGLRIAKAYGLSIGELTALNPGVNWNNLQVGAVINVGDKAGN